MLSQRLLRQDRTSTSSSSIRWRKLFVRRTRTITTRCCDCANSFVLSLGNPQRSRYPGVLIDIRHFLAEYLLPFREEIDDGHSDTLTPYCNRAGEDPSKSDGPLVRRSG